MKTVDRATTGIGRKSRHSRLEAQPCSQSMACYTTLEAKTHCYILYSKTTNGTGAWLLPGIRKFAWFATHGTCRYVTFSLKRLL